MTHPEDVSANKRADRQPPDDTPEALRRKMLEYNRLADLAEKERKIDEAKALYEKGLAIALSLAERQKTAQAYDDLTVSYLALWNLTKDRSMGEKAFQLWDGLCQSCPDFPEFREKRDLMRLMLSTYGQG